jgi:hypothetical protein
MGLGVTSLLLRITSRVVSIITDIRNRDEEYLLTQDNRYILTQDGRNILVVVPEREYLILTQDNLVLQAQSGDLIRS